MNDFPVVGGDFSYSGVSSTDFSNITFEQMVFFEEKPKQFKKSDDLK